MTSEGLITAKVGITLEEAKEILAKARKEKLPIVDDDYNLAGLITIKDIEKTIKYPLAAKDEQGRLLCGAGVGIIMIPTSFRPSVIGTPEILNFAISASASPSVCSGVREKGSVITPFSERFTLSTSSAWASIDMFLCIMPIPPCLAIAIAILGESNPDDCSA